MERQIERERERICQFKFVIKFSKKIIKDFFLNCICLPVPNEIFSTETYMTFNPVVLNGRRWFQSDSSGEFSNKGNQLTLYTAFYVSNAFWDVPTLNTLACPLLIYKIIISTNIYFALFVEVLIGKSAAV